MEQHVIILAIIGVLIMLIAIIAIIVIIVFACTESRREYKRIKNISETDATITDIKLIESNDSVEGPYGPDYYVVSYSFTDNIGKIYSNNFKCQHLDGFEKGGRITIFYDIDDPDKCVTDYKLKADKNKWWQALIIAAVIIIVPVVIAFTID